MKTFKKYIILMIGAVLISSCNLSEIDNYDGPNAVMYGGIYDIETGELVEQDIIRGMQIEYVEDGYSNPETQYLVVKNDGTYMNKLMFANTYTITPVRGNFVPIGPRGISIKGETKVDFQVQPYIRIKNANIQRQGNKVIATFNLEQTVSNRVSRIALFAHQEPNVGDPLNVVSSQQTLNAVVDEETTYTLEIDLDANANVLKPGSPYYFRIGALINAPEAKFNYITATRLTL